MGQGELGDESSPRLLYAATMALSTAPANGHRAPRNQSATGKAEESHEYNQAGSTSGPRGGLGNPAPADDMGSLGRGASAAEITEPERRIPAIPLTAGKWGLILSSPAASATGPATQPEQHIAGKQRHAPVAQLDRASDYGSEGCTFDSCRVYQQQGRLQSQSGGGLRFKIGGRRWPGARKFERNCDGFRPPLKGPQGHGAGGRGFEPPAPVNTASIGTYAEAGSGRLGRTCQSP